MLKKIISSVALFVVAASATAVTVTLNASTTVSATNSMRVGISNAFLTNAVVPYIKVATQSLVPQCPGALLHALPYTNFVGNVVNGVSTTTLTDAASMQWSTEMHRAMTAAKQANKTNVSVTYFYASDVQVCVIQDINYN